MRSVFRWVAAGLTLLACLMFLKPAAAQDDGPRGLFGPRTVGGPISPGVRDRFSRGIQRSPSGSILSLQRDRYAYPRSEPLFAEPVPPLVVVVPVPVPQHQAVPVVPQTRQLPPPRYVRPVPAAPRTTTQPSRAEPLPDTWFRRSGR